MGIARVNSTAGDLTMGWFAAVCECLSSHLSKPVGGNVTEPGVEPTSSGCMSGDRTTDLKRSAVMSDTGIHRLIYRDICVVKG